MRRTRLFPIAVVFYLAGCATVNNFYNRMTGNGSQTVAPDEFMQRQASADKSETLNGDTQMTVTPAAPQTVAASPVTKLDSASAITPAVTPPQTQPATMPFVAAGGAGGTAGAATEPTLSTGQYMAMGGVVADVNGTPIYINKVLQLVWPTLRNDARTMDAGQFYNAAGDEIQRQIEVLESDELLYAAAQRNLDDTQRRLVTDLTTAYRQQLITLAGGSLQEARKRAADNGDDFDQMVENQHRNFLIRLYQQSKFAPLVEPSAEDMRIYYRQNLDALFTEHSEAVFDLIKIDPSLLGGDSPLANRQLAFEQARQAHDRAAAGADFATLFAEYNNDPGLRALTNNTGNMGSMQRGSFSIREIEDAVWKLSPGQVTDVMEVDGILYVAKLEGRKEGRVHPFEDETVQETIAGTIRRNRYAKYYDQERERLLADSIRNVYPEMLQAALDIAMQNYHAWNGMK